MESRESHKYESLKRIVTSSLEPDEAQGAVAAALREAMEVLGVTAASVAILTPQGKMFLNVREGDEKLLGVLDTLEKRMLASLRSDFGLQNIYSTLNQDGEKSLFSYMINSGEINIGTISGICAGNRNIAVESEFIGVMGTALRHVFGQAGVIDSARIDAVKQTTVTLNHEINNPLTVVLGNVQLLLMKGDQLPDDVKSRLQLIEQSSLRIRDVVGKLLKLSEAKSTTYIDDTKMIDLQGSEDSDK